MTLLSKRQRIERLRAQLKARGVASGREQLAFETYKVRVLVRAAQKLLERSDSVSLFLARHTGKKTTLAKMTERRKAKTEILEKYRVQLAELEQRCRDAGITELEIARAQRDL